MSSFYIAHYGIKGQKHGVRRWQYKDGSLTPEGYTHYGYGSNTRRSDNVRKGLSDKTKARLKTAGKVALGVGAAAAVGYGAYKIGKASGRYNKAKVYNHAANVASKLKDSARSNARTYAELASNTARSGYSRAAKFTAESAHDYILRARTYETLGDIYSEKVSALQNYGKKSDRIAYSFVEKIAKNSSVNWRDVEKLLDV